MSRNDDFVTVALPSKDRLEFQRLRLTVVEGPDRGRSHEFANGRVRVGAKPQNELTLTDEKVSGVHLEITIDGAGVRVRDRGSTNGTRVQGLRVHDAYLAPGCEIQVGDSRLRLDVGEGTEEVELYGEDRFGPLIGRSVKMREIFSRLERMAQTDVPVLITGETGSGKEIVARAIHEASPRAYDPFVAVDCSSLPDNLIESELFGHEKGAFTGADRAYAGAFERAGTGTVLLDELGELPLAMQPKLLRALDRCEVRRLGSETVRPIRARFLAATNRDLVTMVNDGTFRDDLYFRIAVGEVTVPPLRERRDDIPLIARHLLERMGAHELDPQTLQALVKHSWPGNVRELKNAVQRVALLGEAPVTPMSRRLAGETAASGPALAVDLERPYKEARDELIARFQAIYTKEMLERADGSVAGAARLAGVDRMTFYRIMKKDES